MKKSPMLMPFALFLFSSAFAQGPAIEARAELVGAHEEKTGSPPLKEVSREVLSVFMSGIFRPV